MLAGLGCSKAAEAPHGSPVLLEVLCEVEGFTQRVWSRDPDAGLPATVSPATSKVDFVFDRRLDGARIEDTIDGEPTPKANPPITVSWPDMADDQWRSDRSPPTSSTTACRPSAPGTSYAFVRPQIAGFPSATAITFVLDPNGLTSVYGEPMDGPPTVTVTTSPLTVTLPNSTATVPLSYQAALVFSTRASAASAMMPFLEVSTRGVTLPFKLVADLGDARRVYVVPACADGWPTDSRIVVTAQIGLPDGFGRPLAAAVKGNFMTARIAATPVDGACGPLDAAQRTAAPTTPARHRRGRRARRRRRRSVELTSEHVGEGAAHRALHGRHLDRPPELADHRAHHRRVQAAGVDRGEARQIGGDVQREPVQRHPAFDRHANRGELALGGGVPDAGPARLARPREPEPRQRLDQRLLEVAQVDVQIALVLAQQEDRVADELAGAVVGDVAAALDLEERRVAEVEQVVALGAARPRVITCGCSTNSSVSGISPCWRAVTSASCIAQTVGVRARAEIDDAAPSFGSSRFEPAVSEIWIASPRLAFAASMIASGRVGWAWMVRLMSSASAPISIASAASAMTSEAPLPTTWMPSTSFDVGVDDDLHEAVGVGVGDARARARRTGTCRP